VTRRCEHAGGACLDPMGLPTPGAVAVLTVAPGIKPQEMRWRWVCEHHARAYADLAMGHEEIRYLAIRPLRAERGD
jgi:hypothetical protein